MSGVGFGAPAGNSGKNKASNKKSKRKGRVENILAHRWQPGQSGNPSGRPKKTALDDALKQLLEEEVGVVVVGRGKIAITPDMTVAQALARGILQHAVKGNARMAQLAAERTGGRPRQQIDLNVSATEQLAERLERARKASGK